MRIVEGLVVHGPREHDLAVERVIDQTAPRLAVMTNDLDRRRLLDAELRRLRWMVKSEIPRALRRMRASGQAGAKVGAGGTAE